MIRAAAYSYWLAVAGALALMSAQVSADQPGASAASVAPVSFTRERSGRFGGATVPYTVTAGETLLRGNDGEPKASIFSFSYVRKDVASRTTRPVLFLFNGGPGSASLWLHMGAFGPRRVRVPSDAEAVGAGPYELVDNTETILDIADLVFIDPVGTGFSRVFGSTQEKEYFGLRPDARSIADFITLWLSANNRWRSPKYLLGESYGTLRAGAVTGALDQHDTALNGVILISAVTDFSAAKTTTGNEIAYIVNMPSMAAAAWYHKKIANRPPDLEAFLEDARRFARTDYALALLQGDHLAPDERARVRARLSAFTGLSEEYLERMNLRVGYLDFVHELLRAEGKVIGFADMRYTATASSADPSGDPSSFGVAPAFIAAMKDYLGADLQIDPHRPYRAQANIEEWDYAGPDSVYVNTASEIGVAMRHYPDMRVLLASGYFDWNTTFFGSEYGLSHSGLDPARLVVKHYLAGHMMYVNGPSRTQLLTDVRAFIVSGSEPRPK
jgi:carboxypeptidase C (cathepsin A)